MKNGDFACVGCDPDLFASSTKFDSRIGWPSFWGPQRRRNQARHFLWNAAHGRALRPGSAPSDKATGDTFQGFAGGSNELANQIKGQWRRGDVFISANPKVNDDLTGAANGDWVSWYVNFAQSPLVIGYNPSSKFAADLKNKPWYEVMQEAGIRIGRTDPKLDPKGVLTIHLFDHAEQVYKQPGLAQKVLGAPDNPAQVFPEETLVGRLQSGQLDVGFFYSTETSALQIPSISLPPEVSLSAHCTATILRNAASPAGGSSFVGFLLGPERRAVMRDHGLDIVKPSVSGDASKMPPRIRSEVDAAK